MTSSPDPLALLRQRAETILQTPVTITEPALTHATGTVARLQAGGTELIGKIHRSQELHQREVHAYRIWAPHLGDVVPQLVAVAPELPGIVITALPGAPLDTITLSPSDEGHVYRSAGHILRQLHNLPTTAETTAVSTYLAARGEHWIDVLEGHLSGRDADLVREHMHRLAQLTTARVAACHLDFQPRNLLWHTDQGVGLIDFENSREDLAARDLARLATRIWPTRPDLKDAFLDGYGPLDSDDISVLQHATALEAVTSLANGLRTNDDYFIRIGQMLLGYMHRTDTFR